MEQIEMIPLTNPLDAIHPTNGKSVRVVGIDLSSSFGPKMIVLVTDVHGTHVDLVDNVKNRRPSA
ncbi:hypothetical protein OOJ09_25910 [Mesorhizobium qingshengii]|uniref:Uncharacterized protein n=1 Tax=Mesorhizobium qingshengii TaxID=1165689 RepID=A0ABT4R1L9_9HYPH|nr:hypothetical protein [Mesorhizobium qingshengii]MCZ8547636.1 hypothetical protein [Mesorhizobium qingshengii]